MNAELAGALAIGALIATVVMAAVAAVFVRRLLSRPTPPGDTIRATTAVLAKVRHRHAMSAEEHDFAAQVIADRRNPAAYALPGAVFAAGCLYVFGCFYQLQGHPPSLRTWIGVLPMLGATNLTVQMLRIARLRSRLQANTPVAAHQVVDDQAAATPISSTPTMKETNR